MIRPLVCARGLGFSYGSTSVFDAVDLAIHPGEALGIIGPNGGGKSTLLRCLAGLERERMRGQVEYEETDLSALSRRSVAQRVAFASQDTTIPFGFNVRQVVTMGRHPYRGRLSGMTQADHEAVESALDRTATMALGNRQLHTLSAGERQRVSIARALAQEPRVLLLDEPASHLDMQHRVRLHQLLSRLHQSDGLAIGLVTHDLASAADHCDRIAILAGGGLLGPASPQEALTPENVEAAFGVPVVMANNPVTGTAFTFPRPETRR